MKYYNPRKTPFLLGVNLEEVDSTPLVNNSMYKQLVGCLLYLTHTWPDIYYVASVEYRNMENIDDMHWREAKRIFHFVQGTKTHGIHYVAKPDLDLVCFTNSYWDSDNTNRK